MILTEFSKYLQKHNNELINNETTTTKLLCEWVISVLQKNPKNNVAKIVHKEILLAKNSTNSFLILGKSDSGRILVNALYKFALSYENYLVAKFLTDKKPHHFNRQENK